MTADLTVDDITALIMASLEMSRERVQAWATEITPMGGRGTVAVDGFHNGILHSGKHRVCTVIASYMTPNLGLRYIVRTRNEAVFGCCDPRCVRVSQ